MKINYGKLNKKETTNFVMSKNKKKMVKNKARIVL